MKHITELINESDEFNLSFTSHKNVYNSFIKWYDKHIGRKMNKGEMIDMLKTIINEIENDDLNFAK
jgi:hypothetical protein